MHEVTCELPPHAFGMTSPPAQVRHSTGGRRLAGIDALISKNELESMEVAGCGGGQRGYTSFIVLKRDHPQAATFLTLFNQRKRWLQLCHEVRR